jgi:hypothetical protein
MNYAVEIDSDAMIYIPSFIKIGSGIQKLIRGIHTHIHGQDCDLVRLLSFFQNKESGLKKEITTQLGNFIKYTSPKEGICLETISAGTSAILAQVFVVSSHSPCEFEYFAKTVLFQVLSC